MQLSSAVSKPPLLSALQMQLLVYPSVTLVLPKWLWGMEVEMCNSRALLLNQQMKTFTKKNTWQSETVGNAFPHSCN